MTPEGSTHVETVFTGTTSSFSRTASAKVAAADAVRQRVFAATPGANPEGQLKILDQAVLPSDHERMNTAESAAARTLQDHAALWSMSEIRAHEVVGTACDALVAGLDSPALRILAACTRAEADHDVPDLLPPALDELGLTFYPVGSIAGQEAAVRALAARMLAGELTPRELTFWIQQRFGHSVPFVEQLAALDDEYDILEYGDRTLAQVDAEVTAEARRLVEHPRALPGGA
ncbi:hypothetical protein AB0C77_19465 [Streptomyces sp. NPDC048629]|uniref:hypothetical protein n=1 Tax=Streptomyces sp. NPDC048629 TaxID=3154824 RepID=UPI003447223F